MAEFKSLNGYEVKDAKAREDISKLNSDLSNVNKTQIFNGNHQLLVSNSDGWIANENNSYIDGGYATFVVSCWARRFTITVPVNYTTSDNFKYTTNLTVSFYDNDNSQFIINSIDIAFIGRILYAGNPFQVFINTDGIKQVRRTDGDFWVRQVYLHKNP